MNNMVGKSGLGVRGAIQILLLTEAIYAILIYPDQYSTPEGATPSRSPNEKLYALIV